MTLSIVKTSTKAAFRGRVDLYIVHRCMPWNTIVPLSLARANIYVNLERSRTMNVRRKEVRPLKVGKTRNTEDAPTGTGEGRSGMSLQFQSLSQRRRRMRRRKRTTCGELRQNEEELPCSFGSLIAPALTHSSA